jgi:hypothetical protein
MVVTSGMVVTSRMVLSWRDGVSRDLVDKAPYPARLCCQSPFEIVTLICLNAADYIPLRVANV